MQCDHPLRQLAAYGPRIPWDQLVARLNDYYHTAEANVYDNRHPEIHQQLPPIWRAMLEVAMREHTGKRWRVLNFGCGTGFEAQQLVQAVTANVEVPGEVTVAQLTCFDPSREMLAHCQRKLARAPFSVRCLSHEHDLWMGGDGYDVLLTNSLLHHLPDPWKTLRQLETLLAPDALWIAGHEPCSRFFENSACLNLRSAYRRNRRLSKLLSPPKLWEALRRRWSDRDTPANRAAVAAWRDGLFTRRPPTHLVARLVDFHVPQSRQDAAYGVGFDPHRMQRTLADSWHLVWKQSYGLFAPDTGETIPVRWRHRCDQLAQRFPDDGPTFSTVWRRLSPLQDQS